VSQTETGRRLAFDAKGEARTRSHEKRTEEKILDFCSLATLSVRTLEPTSAGLRFRILRPHAQGGLGQVSVALDSELRREVALKEIQTRYADDPVSRARFLREAEITGGLEHPGIVPVYGLGADADGRPFYAMRFIRGDSDHTVSRERSSTCW
jgi:serine/threonine protein kinase